MIGFRFKTIAKTDSGTSFMLEIPQLIPKEIESANARFRDISGLHFEKTSVFL